MLDLFTAISTRKSYRGKYKSVPVPREDLTKIMAAGLEAPSGCNMQTTSLIAVDDPSLLAEIKAMQIRPIFQTAPAVICVLTQRLESYHGKAFNVQDYAAAIENMLLAIKALGYESCWYEGYMTDENNIGRKIADLLGVPKEYELVCILPVGIAEDEPRLVTKKAFEEWAWFNRYNK